MANWYVWSGATGLGDGTDWANAYVRLRLATAAKAAGDTFFVAHDHAETEAVAMTITSPGTEASPCRIYCVNRAGSVPPVSADLRATATISTTVASAIAIAGSVSECYGIIFSAGTTGSAANLSISATSNRTVRLVNCALRLGATNVANRIGLGSATGSNAILENCTLQFAATGQRVQTAARATWRNTPSALTGATLPSSLFGFSSNGFWTIEGVDISALTGAGKYLVAGNDGWCGQVIMKDCKLGSPQDWSASAAVGSGTVELVMIRCDSGDTNYRTEKYAFSGAQLTDTIVVRTDGASDGATPISWRIVTTANSEWDMPFECLPISVWSETVGSPVTVTIEGIWGGGAVPLSDEIWIDVEYLGTSGNPLASKATSNKADGLATGTSIPAGSGTWGGSTTKFAMSATFTPQEKGPITIYVRAGKASSTFYIDPKPVVT